MIRLPKVIEYLPGRYSKTITLETPVIERIRHSLKVTKEKLP